MKLKLIASALALSAMSSFALAAEPVDTNESAVGPVELTEVQMDNVTAAGHRLGHGGLIVVDVDARVIRDVDVEVRNVQVGVAAAVAVLGAAGAATGQQIID
jgi:hypothetical protein